MLITVDEIPSLYHEALDYSVEYDTLVVQRFACTFPITFLTCET